MDMIQRYRDGFRIGRVALCFNYGIDEFLDCR